ncbi:MAG: SDR family NAD(P)-dependent oxidoreductase [Rhizobiaceae bacterium]|nr:SDR family NAD(P)-dependent oxidoreductase [Rhizobiaceae bacterium]
MQSDVVVITGAAGNLGSAVVKELAARGVRLVCLERNAATLDTLAAGLPAGTEVLKLPGVDLMDFDACRNAIAAAEARFGAIHALVNTVGGFHMGPVGESGLSEWDSLMALNARTAYSISAAVLPAMQKAGYGRIVHVAAAPGLKAGARQAAYAASKAAVIRLTEAIALENRAHKITANCILPGTIDTPQNRAAMPDAKPDSFVPAGSIAKLIAYLVSAEAGVVTGAAIHATGS